MYVSVRDHPPTAGEGTPTGRRRVSRVVVTLGIVSLLTDISSESVAAVLPLYLTAVVGLSPVAYGLVDGLHQGVTALVRIAGGWGADRSGHPKWVAFIGYAISAVSRIGLLFAAGLGAIVAVISADRVGKGLRTAPRDAMIVAATDPAHLGRAFGVHRTLDTIGAALGPVVAFTVLWLVPDGYTTVIVVSFGFAVLGVALLGLLVPGRTDDRKPGSPAPAPAPARTAVPLARRADPTVDPAPAGRRRPGAPHRR